MSPKATSPVRVLSQVCTHVLPDEGLELVADVVTEIPNEQLNRVLELEGVIQITDKE